MIRKTSRFAVLEPLSAAPSGTNASLVPANGSNETALQSMLAELGVEHVIHDHEAAFTVEEQAKVVGHLQGALTKNLFLRDKKYGLFLITAAAGTQISLYRSA